MFTSYANKGSYDPKDGWSMALSFSHGNLTDLDPKNLAMTSPNVDNLNLDGSGQLITFTSNDYNFDLTKKSDTSNNKQSRGKLVGESNFNLFLNIKALNGEKLPYLKFNPSVKFFNQKYQNLGCLVDDDLTAELVDGSKFNEAAGLSETYFSHVLMSLGRVW